MTRWLSAAWLVALLGACSSCRETASALDATGRETASSLDATVAVDIPWSEYQPPRGDAPLEAPPSVPRCGLPPGPLAQQPPWADCTLRITPTPVQPTPLPPCGPGRFVLNFPLSDLMEGTCVHDGWIYASGGFTRRVRISDGRVETLTRAIQARDLAGSWGCTSQGLVFAANLVTTSEFSNRAVAIVHFADLDRPGQVQWHHTLRLPPGGDVGGLEDMRASDVFSFFRFTDQSPAFFYVASPTGENPRRLDIDPTGIKGNFVLDGPYLSYSSDWDIHLYDHRTGTVENLTQTDTSWEQFSAIDGERVAYIEHRTRDPFDYNNANVWLLDLRTRTRTPITAQPAQPAAQRFNVALRGDWILWEDCRDAPDPNPGIDTCAYRTLYGYNLRTHREVSLTPGVGHSGSPFIVRDQLYYACAATRGSPVGTYVMDLPRE